MRSPLMPLVRVYTISGKTVSRRRYMSAGNYPRTSVGSHGRWWTRFFLVHGVPMLKYAEDVDAFITMFRLLPQTPDIIALETTNDDGWYD
jgi:hypothetical protein